MNEDIVMVGAFPPPVHGVSAINQAIVRLLEEGGRQAIIINIAAPSLARGIAYHVLKAKRALGGLPRLWAARKSGSRHLYMSVSGGYGQIHELLYMLLARFFGFRVTLHHHSYAYLTRPRLLTRLLFSAGPSDTRHIALSAGMASRLQRLYRIDHVQVLSNAAFMADVAVVDAPDRPLRKVGFLSNIAAEKGIYEFIDLLDACVKAGQALEGIIAGPFQDAATESGVMALIGNSPFLHYVGPRYGADKDAFYASLDVLAFPTRYANEAEPVTVLEALMHGVPVIAYGRGAIPEMLDGTHGAIVAPEQDFVAIAKEVLLGWLREPASFAEARRCSRDGFCGIRARSSSSLRTLLASLGRGDRPFA